MWERFTGFCSMNCLLCRTKSKVCNLTFTSVWYSEMLYLDRGILSRVWPPSTDVTKYVAQACHLCRGCYSGYVARVCHIGYDTPVHPLYAVLVMLLLGGCRPRHVIPGLGLPRNERCLRFVNQGMSLWTYGTVHVTQACHAGRVTQGVSLRACYQRSW